MVSAAVTMNALPTSYRIGDDIEIWLSDLDDCFLACRTTEPADRNKIATLRRAIGEDHVQTVRELQSQLPEGQREAYADVRKAVLEHFSKKTSIILERHIFNTMHQEDGELIDSYVARLRIQAAKCKYRVPSIVANDVTVTYKDLTEDFIRDRIVVGILDSKTRARLLRTKDLT